MLAGSVLCGDACVPCEGRAGVRMTWVEHGLIVPLDPSTAPPQMGELRFRLAEAVL